MDPDALRARPPAQRTDLTSIVKQQEIEKRRQQRPVNTSASLPRVPGLVLFSGRMVSVGGDITWTSAGGAATDGNIITPGVDGWWSCDVTWRIEGADPGTHHRPDCGGPPYHGTSAGGKANVIASDDGIGIDSTHWQGILTRDGGLAIGGAGTDYEAVVIGCLVKEM